MFICNNQVKSGTALKQCKAAITALLSDAPDRFRTQSRRPHLYCPDNKPRRLWNIKRAWFQRLYEVL